MERINIEIRIEAYNLFKKLKEKGLTTYKVMKEVQKKYKISITTLYAWAKNKQTPFGRGKIKFCRDLFYALGALLGDGCIYYWKKRKVRKILLTGEKEFTEKYCKKISKCTNSNVKNYINRNQNIWFVALGNIQLYLLFKDIKENFNLLINLLKNGNQHNNSFEFIEGFFDAEGCVKIIKEKVRKTPKICLDICNTDKRILDLIQILLKKELSIEARYSIQVPKKSWKSNNKKTIYYLRIYKKEYIRKFFENIQTIKLKENKINYVNNWLNNGKGS